MIDEQAREKNLLAMERARRKARVVVEIKWLLKRRGIKVKGHKETKEPLIPLQKVPEMA
jgi:hypothetical protein